MYLVVQVCAPASRNRGEAPWGLSWGPLVTWSPSTGEGCTTSLEGYAVQRIQYKDKGAMRQAAGKYLRRQVPESPRSATLSSLASMSEQQSRGPVSESMMGAVPNETRPTPLLHVAAKMGLLPGNH
jgi:hypothetical protein